MLIHGSHLDLDNSVQVFPEGPVDAGEGLWSWWRDGPRQQETVAEFLVFGKSLLDRAGQLIEEQAAGARFQTCLWGFSQGAAAALVYALLGHHPIHKTASICGFLPELPDGSPLTSAASQVLGIYGANDEVVPSFLAEHALEQLRDRGHRTSIKETAQGHEVSAENLGDLAAFFSSP